MKKVGSPCVDHLTIIINFRCCFNEGRRYHEFFFQITAKEEFHSIRIRGNRESTCAL
jgi:hypothetical protein